MPLYLKDKLVSGTGTPGKSAYQAAVDAGYVGTEATFNEALSDVPGHIANTDNPHSVTAAQVNAYTKGETDTLLSNKAPSGYGGFGETLPYITSGNNDTDGSKFDALIEAKFATLADNTTLQLRFDCYPYISGSIFFGVLWRSSANYGVLTGWSYDGSIIRKVKTGGAWIPFEWVNPPLTIDKEYRTTERYKGKPVYVKMIEAGFNPAGKVKTTSDKTVSASGLVRFSAVSGVWSFPSFMYGGNYTDDGDIQVAVQATSDGIHVFTWSKIRDMTSRTTNVSVYYTKD